MGSRFKKKKPKKQYGWLTSEVDMLQKVQDNRDSRVVMLTETYCRMKEISAYLMHEEYGYGKKKLENIEMRMDIYLMMYEEGKMTMEELDAYVLERVKIDTKEIVKQIPDAFKMKLIKELLPKYMRNSNTYNHMKMVNQGMQLFFILNIPAVRHQKRLKTTGKHYYDMSRADVREYLNKFSKYIEILMYQNKYGLVHSDFVSVLDDIGYKVKRHDIWQDDYLDGLI